ncbi:hypothetical protein KJ962_02345 [Patescibacteria group bacterium]|nr:hypothetical protein [Patescibacteria group bacterium]MBU2214599.1 hypothetical protein [Patescibacteria group bacterium]MBU2250047.1 hypothetical protein [Patescibacteria group bacterium]
MEEKKVTSKTSINARTMEEKKALSKPLINTNVFDVIIGSILMLIFFLCPLFFTGLTAQTVGFEKMTLFYFLVLLGVVVWVTKGVVGGELNFKRTPLDIPILALLVTFIISTILSVNSQISLVGSYENSTKSLIAVIIYILFYYLLVNNIDIKKIKLIFWSLIASASLVAIYSLLQIFGLFVLPFAFTKFANFNPLGTVGGLTTFLTIVLPLFIVSATQLKEIHPNFKNKIGCNIVKAILIIFSLISLCVLIILNGFTFWPAAIVGSVIVLMFFLSKVVKVTNSNIIIPVVVFALLIIFLVLGNFNIVNLNLPTEVGLSRSISWQIAKSSIVKDPFFGSGPSTFDYSFSHYKNSNFNNTQLWNVRFDSSAGILSELIATIGSLGTLAFILIVLIALSISFISLIKNSAIKNNAGDLQSILLALFASFVSTIVLALLFSLTNSLILISVIIATLTISVSIVTYPEKFQNISLTFRASPKYALALAAIFLTISAGVVILFTMGIKTYLADVYAMKSIKTADLDQKINYLSKAVQLAPYRDIYYINLANNYMAKANQEATGGKNQSIMETALTSAIDNGKKAVEIAPNNVADNEALALIYENASFYTRGAWEWAENLYKKTAVLEPNSPVPYLRMALINMARANAETDKNEQANYINEAIKKYDEAIAKKNDFDAAYYGKGTAYEKLGKLDDAIEQLKRAVIMTKSNVNYRFELGRMFFNRGVSKPNLEQNVVTDITKGEDKEGDLSVKPDQAIGELVVMNDDLKSSEQLLLSIVQIYPNHVNAIYSLALLYKKVGDTDKAKIAVASLLANLTDQASIDMVKQQFVGLY